MSAVLDKMAALLGAGGLLRGEAMAPYLREARGTYEGAALAVARPRTAQDAAQIVRIAGEAGLHIVPQSGNTGLVGGQMPFDAARALVLSTERMTRIRALDAANHTMIAEAGCILADIQETARDAGLSFPLGFASEGTCRLGGVLATNAGGHHVLRYGMARSFVLGLEVVLADGRVWNGLRSLRKDNTGYALASLFVGSEGTLGLITAAVLTLHARAGAPAVLFAAVPSPDAAVAFLRLAQGASEAVDAFELIPRIGLEFCLRHLPGARDPLNKKSEFYILAELPAACAEEVLADALSAGHITDATLAASQAQAEALWQLRSSLSEVQKREGASLKHDIAVPVSRVGDFIKQASDAVAALVPRARAVPFGHIGDGNIHFNISRPPDMEDEAFLARRGEVAACVYDLVEALGGTISAEHGIGILKRDALAMRKSAVEMNMMRAVKNALDPKNIFNPGKLLTLSRMR